MLYLGAVLVPIVGGTAVSLLKHIAERTRNLLYVLVMAATDVLAACAAAFSGPVNVLRLTERIAFSFRLDAVGKFFLICVLLLYTAVLFYSFEYMKKEERPNVFFAFFFISFGAMLSVCGASNLVTVYLCFEIATLTSVPLVLHELSKEAVAAGMKYLFYSIGGALLGLLGLFFVYQYAGESTEFTLGGFLDPAKYAGHEGLLLAMVFLAIIGFGTKAGMYPMHGWLPTAHPIAPAPASSLLSGIIAKAGIIAVIRLVFFSVGAEFLRGTWVQTAWMCIAMLTIFMGSMMAFREKVTKKRLAYSTISQISYIMLGLSLLTPEGLVGGLLQVAAHVAAKGCLFLCAGVFIYKLGSHSVTELRGVGKKMPVVMWCFLFASLSLVGIPPMGGFTSKWYLALAAIGSGQGVLSYLAPVVLLISALLTAGYLFPVVIDAFFPGKAEEAPSEEKTPASAVAAHGSAGKKDEAPALMTAPMIALCCVALFVGVFGSRIAAYFGGILTF